MFIFHKVLPPNLGSQITKLSAQFDLPSSVTALQKNNFCLFSDQKNFNKQRVQYVFASSAGGSRKSSDESDCLHEPGERACSTLNFILTNIFRNNMFWINTIYLNNYRPTEPEIINLPDFLSDTQESISIICSKPCHLETDFTIVMHKFQQNLLLEMKNITFENSKISLWNVHMIFRDVQLVNSVVTDWQPTKGSFGELVLQFINTKMGNSKAERGPRFGLILNKTFSAAVVLMNSDFVNVSTEINVPHLMFEAMYTTMKHSTISLFIALFCFMSFEHVSFSNESIQHQDKVILNVASNQLYLTITHCIVQNSAGGFRITKQDSGLLKSRIHVFVHNCIFLNNRKFGSGAAIEFFFFAPEASKPEGVNTVQIKDSLFAQNKAQWLAVASSEGGAVSVFSMTPHDHCHVLHILIQSSIFTDNQAADGGGALYISDKCLKTTISNCSFQVTDPIFDSPKGIFIWSLSTISVDSSQFIRDVKLLSHPLLELEMLSDQAEILHLNIHVQCHRWAELTLESTFIEQQAKAITMRCTTCPASFYLPSDGQFIVSYTQNQTSVSVQGKMLYSSDLKCEPCPPGANCPGNDITAKPNFWGSNADHVITMHQCPADYCCTTNCTGHDQCSGHRTGVLCGSCVENYSLSMLSSECIDVETCKDHWLWPLVVLAVVLYLGWCTFKNDIFGIPTFIVKTLCKTCSSHSDDSDVYYIDKGYFGIVTYFIQVQAVLKVSASFQTERKIDNIFTQIESYIELGLNFELTYFSENTCALQGLTTTNKMMFKIFFLFGIFLLWNIIFVLWLLLTKLVATNEKLKKFKIKLILGLVEIIKYTYLGFTSIVFYSLTCTSVDGNAVWFYDGSVQCYSVWQTVMIIFCLVYILPYPFMVYLGVKLLSNEKISQKSFFLALYFPLPVMPYWLFLLWKQHSVRDSQEDSENPEMGLSIGKQF